MKKLSFLNADFKVNKIQVVVKLFSSIETQTVHLKYCFWSQFFNNLNHISKVSIHNFQMETPLTSLATPPSHEKLGENARRRLFNSPGRRAALLPYVRQLTFNETDEEVSGFATSTPAATNTTIFLGSSPWEKIDAQLPPLQGPRAEEVLNASTPGWRDQLLADLHRVNTPMTDDSPAQNPSPFPREVRHLLRGNLDRPVKVVVTRHTTYEIIPQ